MTMQTDFSQLPQTYGDTDLPHRTELGSSAFQEQTRSDVASFRVPEPAMSQHIPTSSMS